MSAPSELDRMDWSIFGGMIIGAIAGFYCVLVLGVAFGGCR